MCVIDGVLRTLSPYLPSLLAFILFWLPPPQGFLNSEERALKETCHLGLSAPTSLILCGLSSCEALYVFPSTAEGSFPE